MFMSPTCHPYIKNNQIKDMFEWIWKNIKLLTVNVKKKLCHTASQFGILTFFKELEFKFI